MIIRCHDVDGDFVAADRFSPFGIQKHQQVELFPRYGWVQFLALDIDVASLGVDHDRVRCGVNGGKLMRARARGGETCMRWCCTEVEYVPMPEYVELAVEPVTVHEGPVRAAQVSQMIVGIRLHSEDVLAGRRSLVRHDIALVVSTQD